VPRGHRSLLRRARSVFGCPHAVPLVWCVVTAALLLPGPAWAQLRPDPPPPGLHGSAPTSLKPDELPVRTRRVTPPPPAPVEETPAAVVTETPDLVREAPEVQTAQPAPKQARPKPAPPVDRRFVLASKPERRPPPAAPIIHTFTADSDPRRPYLLAALSLAVLAVGSGTLLTVLTRLRSARGLA
jgi:hypothetical protein